jgi:alkylation response protein AidB-like acyl-CoA dehydrogenase
MSVELSEIQDSARQIANEIGVAASEEKTWPLILDLGLLQVAVPEELGGLGQGFASTGALYRELGASLASGPYLSSILAIDAICQSELTNREQWIERATGTDTVVTALADTSLSVSAAGDSIRVSGIATAVPGAETASHILIYTADGEHVALVPRTHPKVAITSRPTWDTTRRLFDVRFDNVELASELTLARGQAAKALTERLLTHRDLALAADSVGGASALLSMTIEYLQARRQYGRPLALFQALKHRCADLKVLISTADAYLTDTLGRLPSDAGAQETTAAKTAKYLACSAYARVAEEAVQLHGGIGVTSDHSCHLFLKRAMLNECLGRQSSYESDIADAWLSAL